MGSHLQKLRGPWPWVLGLSSQGSTLQNVLPQLTHHPEPGSLFRSQLPRRCLPHPSPRRCPPEGLFTPAAQEEKDLVVPSSQHSVWRETKSKGRTRVVGTPGFSSKGWPVVVSRVMVQIGRAHV